MPTLATTVDGLKLPNPFVIGSGPPGTNLNVIQRAFREGWGAVIAKTISLDASKVVNVTPRYAKLHSTSGEVIGWENIELISDRPFNIWLDEFKKCKDAHPTACSSPPSWRNTARTRGSRSSSAARRSGVDAFELNFSCPHGLPERKMGAAMGEEPGHPRGSLRLGEKPPRKKPFWAKMTPNVTHIEEPGRAALRAGATGLSAINTIRSVMGVNLDTLRPEPTVEGYTTPGGYSSKAVKPIALRMVMEIAQLIRKEFPRPLALRPRRRRERRRRRAIHPARLRHRAGLHRRDEVRLRMREADVRPAARVHGEAQVRDARRFQGQEPRLLHHPRRPRAKAGRAQSRAKSRRRRQGREERRRMERRRIRETIRRAPPHPHASTSTVLFQKEKGVILYQTGTGENMCGFGMHSHPAHLYIQLKSQNQGHHARRQRDRRGKAAKRLGTRRHPPRESSPGNVTPTSSR